MSRGVIRRVGLALGLLALVACGADRKELAEIRERQEEILQRLARLEAAEAQTEPPRQAVRPGPPEDGDLAYRIDVGNAPSIGRPDAPVTVVEFADFQCPYCAATRQVLRDVLDRYGDNVRLVYKHFPLSFHAMARPAARAALAAQEQNGFWEMHDLLFEQTDRLAEDAFPDLARRAGLDVERFVRDYETKREEHGRRIDEDYALGLTANVRGTPTIFVNGRRVSVRTLEEISAMIDQELSKASSS